MRCGTLRTHTGAAARGGMHACVRPRLLGCPAPRCSPSCATPRRPARLAASPASHGPGPPASVVAAPLQRSPAAQLPAPQLHHEELLWAGYSDLTEQLQRLQRRHDELVGSVEQLQRRLVDAAAASPQGAWQAASSLALFVLCVNFAGLLAHVHAGLFLPPWVAKPAGAALVKAVLAVALPLTNTAVVVVFCLQALKAAWTCLRW